MAEAVESEAAKRARLALAEKAKRAAAARERRAAEKAAALALVADRAQKAAAARARRAAATKKRERERVEQSALADARRVREDREALERGRAATRKRRAAERKEAERRVQYEVEQDKIRRRLRRRKGRLLPGDRADALEDVERACRDVPLGGTCQRFHHADGVETEWRFPASLDGSFDEQWVDVELKLRDALSSSGGWVALGLIFRPHHTRLGRYDREGRRNSQIWLHPRRAHLAPYLFADVRKPAGQPGAILHNCLSAGYVVLALGVRHTTSKSQPSHWK